MKLFVSCVLHVSDSNFQLPMDDYLKWVCEKKNISMCSLSFLRCLCPSDTGRQHCGQRSIGFLLCFFSSWFGSHCNDTYPMVSWHNRVDLRRQQRIPRLRGYCGRPGQIAAAIWVTKRKRKFLSDNEFMRVLPGLMTLKACNITGVYLIITISF